ncbi:deoxyribodipyrimidine photo-lyase [Alpinimonas psychrophila]|uniref:Deoxyribodipyrimidine photo-lyase n=1 Tax=Alpinimonas psychrophila TaxID=748908 RepID=A0A7W3JUW0_9MICO|nr:deoxyribodipyrimidine photo-lyase [Alpinimonas psychrophila]MBA8829537.1 deoxyribodipyrimidine photo-lyase [Alpinimonas psychrophila]
MNTSIVWLRDDLRVSDNPALLAGAETSDNLVVVYVLDQESPGIRPLGGATKWWLHHSLEALADKLQRLGGRLILRHGPAHDVLRELIAETSAHAIFWNRRYGGAERELDATIKSFARASGLKAQSFQASVLFEPWTVRTGGGTPYTVFTPFWKSCINNHDIPRMPLDAPPVLPHSPLITRAHGGQEAEPLASDDLASWHLLPTAPDWSAGLAHRWTIGENAAHERLEDFIDTRLPQYADGRDAPARLVTSELSPHLRFGEISPFQVWHRVEAAKAHGDAVVLKNAIKFMAEVGWREFSYHLLYHWPDLATVNFDSRFDAFPWGEANPEALAAWQQGRTGIPLVDAGMRELWQSGTMHNRVRMVAASFLIKNLLIDWRVGEQWFWDTLVDADPASNAASWQWVAGSGADAAPYFRVFNPVLQADKFDPQHEYLHRYLGEYEHPLVSDYPLPIIDLVESRNRALAAFAQLQGIPRAIRPPSP